MYCICYSNIGVLHSSSDFLLFSHNHIPSPMPLAASISATTSLLSSNYSSSLLIVTSISSSIISIALSRFSPSPSCCGILLSRNFSISEFAHYHCHHLHFQICTHQQYNMVFGISPIHLLADQHYNFCTTICRLFHIVSLVLESLCAFLSIFIFSRISY
jgi:hypothetical protein